MRKNKLLHLAFLAAAGIGMLQSSVQAAAVTYNNGDLLLGVRASGGTGSTKDYVINIGPAANYAGASTSFIVPIEGIAADLATIFGPNWQNRADLYWSVTGTTGLNAVGATPAKTLYATAPQSFSAGSFTPAIPWTSQSSASQGGATSNLISFKNGYLAQGAVLNQSTANTDAGIIQQTTDINSYAFFTGDGGASFDYFNPTVEGRFANGVAGSRLDLFQVSPSDGATISVGDPGELLGTFFFYASGHLAFIAAGGTVPDDTVPPESVAPVIKLASTPKAGAKFTTAGPVSFSGSVIETGSGLAALTYSINGGTAQAIPFSGSSPYALAASIPLSVGPNNVTFTAVDNSGNVTTASRLVYFVSPLSNPNELIGADPNKTTVTVNNGGIPVGTVSLPKGAINEGYTYTLAAKPAAGYIVKEWKKSVGGGVPVGTGLSGNTLSITAEEGVEYTAEFVENFFPDVAGTYPGIFGTGFVAPTVTLATQAAYKLENGGATFKLTGTGAFTGTVTIGGKAIALKGAFNGLKTATVTASGLALNLTLDNTTPASAFITGTATYNGGTPVAIKSYLAPTYTGKGNSISPLNGKRFSVALQREALATDTTLGHGFASVAVGKTGIATVSGQLPDGTVFTASVNAVDKGSGVWSLPISRQLAKGNTGLIHGELLITDDGAPLVGDTIEANPALPYYGLGWLRAASAKPTDPFSAGILKNLGAVGSEWTLTKQDLATKNLLTVNLPPLTGEELALFSLKLDKDNAFNVSGAPNVAELYWGFWPSNNKPGINALPKGNTFAFVPSTGAFSGKTSKTVVVGTKTKVVAVPYKGLVLPDKVDIGPAPALHGVGYLLNGSISGKVELGESVVTP